MARYTGPVCRLCRREGQKLFLKGERCYSERLLSTDFSSVQSREPEDSTV